MAIDITNTLLTGFIMLFIGLIAYQTGYRWFKPWGDYRFTSKSGAQITLIAFVFITGLLGDPILQAVRGGTAGFNNIQQLGLIILASRFAANASVPDWTHGDGGTFIQYIIGAGMVLFGG